MSVADILKDRMAFSFEVFPPKTDAGMAKLCGEGGVLDHLYELNPDYISCTYGAGGTNVGKNLEVLDKIHKDGKCIPVTHFTCVANTKEGIKEQLQTYLDHGIDHRQPHAPTLLFDRRYDPTIPQTDKTDSVWEVRPIGPRPAASASPDCNRQSFRPMRSETTRSLAVPN